jgi:hypothetical protein
MDEEVNSRVGIICVSLLLMITVVQILPFENPVMRNASGGSVIAESDDGDFIEGTLVGISVFDVGPSAELRLELNDTGKWIEMSPPFIPNARRGHVLSSIYGTDKVLLFGGYDGGYYNDTWIYDLSDDEWMDMQSLGQKPEKRHSAAMAFIWATDKVVLFGGNTESGLSNETWLYDLSDDVWVLLKPPFYPDSREYHEMEPVYNDDKVILFGGFNGSDYLKDTWVYDLSDNLWVLSEPIQNPSPRKGHEMATFYGTDKMLFFGGNESGITLRGDTWTYTLSSNEWNEQSPDSGAPTPRTGHGMAGFYDTDKAILFGPDDQTWIYDLSDNEWTLKPTTIQPSPRGVTHVMAPVFNDDKVVLFGGGYTVNGTNFNLDDTWVYDLASYEQEGAYLSAPHDLGSNTLLKTIDWTGETPPGTTVMLQIRTAQTEPDLFTKNPVGPDGLTTSFYTNPSGETIWEGHQGDRWLQYKVYMTGTIEASPSVSEVNIKYNHIPEPPMITSPENDVWTNDNTPYFEWTFLDSDSTSGGFQLLMDDDITFTGVDFDSGQVSSNNEFWQFPDGTSYIDISDGIWFWKVRTQDSDGDWGDYSLPFILKIDSSVPASSLENPADLQFYNSMDSITGTASDNGGSGIEGVQISIKRVSDDYFWTGTSWGPQKSWLSAIGTELWEYDASSVTWESGHKFSVEVRSTDNGNNQEMQGPVHTFSFDSEIPSVTIDPVLEGAYLTDLETISGSSQDSGGSEVASVEIAIKRNSDDHFWDSGQWVEDETWIPTIGTDQWSFDSQDVAWSSDMSYSLMARAWDKVGNLMITEDPTSVMIDSKAPSGLLILINNGDTFTKDTEVILNLNSYDGGSGVDKMGFSTDGINWSPWEDYTITRSYTLLSGDGTKNVYFRVRDKAGNVAEPVYAQIVLDTTVPPLDTDSDGAFDEQDAFPQDPAASIDSDSDGYPDSWNQGKTQGQSTTGLTLDEYPQDPTKHALEIEDEKPKTTYETIPFLIVPLVAVVLLVVFLLLMKLYRNNGKNE